MGKLKTKKGVAKRFKITGKKKIKYHSGGKSHLASSKKTKRIRKLKKPHLFASGHEAAFLKRSLPYG